MPGCLCSHLRGKICNPLYKVLVFLVQGCSLQKFFFFFKMYFFYVWVHCSCLQTPQKRASDLIIDEPPCGCWELGSWPLEEQPISSEPCLHPLTPILTSIVQLTYIAIGKAMCLGYFPSLGHFCSQVLSQNYNSCLERSFCQTHLIFDLIKLLWLYDYMVIKIIWALKQRSFSFLSLASQPY